MMEQESKQVEQSPEGWKELTVEKMAKLMLDMTEEIKPQGEGSIKEKFAPSWGNLWKMVDKTDRYKIEEHHFRRLYSTVGYLFTFVAAIAEKETKGELVVSDIENIVKKYHIDFFCDCGSTYNFYILITRIITDKEEDREKNREKSDRLLRDVYERILSYLADASGTLSPESKVIEVFKWLVEKNMEAVKKSEEISIEFYYNNFKAILNTWWGDCGSAVLEHSGIPEKAPDPLKKLLDELNANPFAKEAGDRIEQGVKQIIFTGAPGTGKTYAAKLIARCMGAKLKLRESEEPKEYALVQFHPSYDYTDFVEGLRPVQIGGENRFVKLDGQFKAFCRKVVDANNRDVKKGEDPKNKKYFFLIDEINRADLSKVFGELMFCLEADKRVRLESDGWSKDDFEEQKRENSVQTQYQNLATYDIEKAHDLTPEEDVFHSGFFIPDNVIVIGTMNDIDRSVESMDFALRRRFDWMEAMVDGEVQRTTVNGKEQETVVPGAMLERALSHIFKDMKSVNTEELAKSVVKLNDVIKSEGVRYGLTRQHFISQGQFANLPNLTEEQTAEAVKEYVWKYRLEPLLREYLRGEDEGSIDMFINGQKKQQDGSQEEEKKVCCKKAFFSADGK